MKKIFLVFLIALLSSCEKWKIDKNSSDLEGSFSISCFISPNDTLQIAHIYSLGSVKDPSLFKDLDSLIIKNAIITISNDSESYQFKYSDEQKAYISTFSVKPNSTYFLQVKVKDIIATSSCVVPAKAVIVSDGIELQMFNSNSGRLKLQWRNPVGQNAAFNVKNNIKSGFSSRNLLPIGPYEVFEKPKINSSIFEIDQEFSLHQFNISDAVMDFEIIALSPELATFSKEIQFSNALIGFTDYGFFEKFIPLTDLFSNIENGYGIFGAYNSVKLEKKVIL